jgi:hypothetical protein
MLFLIAAFMAIFGVIGYKNGFWRMFWALGILFVAVLVVRREAGDTIIRYMNGLYIGAMLVFKSGLNDMASGDLESAAAKLESVEKPFTDERDWLAYLLILAGAVFLGWLFTRIIKPSPSLMGLFMGLLYGYVLAAALFPLVLGFSTAFFPLTPGYDQAQAAGGACVPGGTVSAGSIGDRLVCFLSDPANAQVCGVIIVISISVFVLWAARKVGKGVSGVASASTKKG